MRSSHQHKSIKLERFASRFRLLHFLATSKTVRGPSEQEETTLTDVKIENVLGDLNVIFGEDPFVSPDETEQFDIIV